MRAMMVAGVIGLASAASAQETMYVINDPLMPFLLELDKSDGSILDTKLVTGYEALFGGLAVDDAGDLFSIDGFNDGNEDRLFHIDAATGAGAVIGDTGFNWNFRNVVVHPQTDVLWGSRDSQLFTFDKGTGEATFIATVTAPTLDQMTTFAIDSMGNAYGTDIGNTGLFRIDLATGAAEHLGDIGGNSNWFEDLAFDENDMLWGARRSGGMYTIDVDAVSESLQFSGVYPGVTFFIEGGCAADCNGDGMLSILDFVCFQQEWQAQTAAGDCDGNGSYDVLDFVCYQTIFQAGCP